MKKAASVIRSGFVFLSTQVVGKTKVLTISPNRTLPKQNVLLASRENDNPLKSDPMQQVPPQEPLLLSLLAQDATLTDRLSEAPPGNQRLINKLLKRQRAILRRALRIAKALQND